MSVARRNLWVLVTVTLVLAAVALGVIDRMSEQAMRREIPAPPDLSGAAPTVVEAVTSADREARRHPGSGEAVGALGMTYHANAFHDHARHLYRRAGVLDPGDARWPYYRGVLELTLGDHDRAVEALEAALACDPGLAYGWARLGQLRLRRGETDEAESAFRRALEILPTQPHAAVDLGRLLGDRGDWEGAVRVLDAAVRADPGYGPAQRMLAIAYDALGRDADARRHERLGSSVGLEMRDPLMLDLYLTSSTGSVLVTQAKIAETWGDATRAETFLRRAEAVAPDDVDVLLALGRFLSGPMGGRSVARLREARSTLERAIRLDPSYLNLRHDYAIALQASGDTTAAASVWRDIIATEPQHAMAHMSLGQISFFRGDLDAAREHYQRGLAVPADTPYTLGQPALGYERLAAVLERAGHPDTALDAYETATTLDARLGEAWSGWASLLARLGRSDEAVRVFRRGVEANPDDGMLHFAFGNHLLQAGAWTDARRELSAARDLMPNDYRVLAALGYVHLRRGEVGPAERELRRSIDVNPNFAQAHLHLGTTLMRRGARDEAIAHFESAVRLAPGLDAAREALARARGGSR